MPIREIRRARQIKSIRAPRSPIKQVGLRSARPPALRTRFIPSIKVQQVAELESRAVPVTEVMGTILERIVYKALLQKKVIFEFHSSMAGGVPGFQFGRQVADFVLYTQNTIIEVQGAYWHSPIEQYYRDADRNLILSAKGWTVLYLWEDDVVDPVRLNDWLDRHITSAELSTHNYSVSAGYTGV